MKKAAIAGAALAAVLVLVALAVSRRAPVQAGSTPPPPPPSTPAAVSVQEIDRGFLYGRVFGVDGTTYEGRLRFGGDQEAFWGDYFNGFKDESPWATHAPFELTRERRSIGLFGFELSLGESQADLGRPLMARFGDIARLEARGRDLWVTLKSGTVFHLDRFAADDYADGLRVWDARHGIVDLDEWEIGAIELLPTTPLVAVPVRLHGTVRTAHGTFTGFIQWDREACVGSDQLAGHTDDGEIRLRFDAIRAIARRSSDSARVTLLDGSEVVLSGTRDVGDGHRGIYVDDRRYGRVLVSWEAFERIDFNAAGSGPAYSDFPPGRPLAGSVTTRAGRRFTGRLVYDLDESETTETLDAPSRGVDYTIPFGLIASIEPAGASEGNARRARVRLHDGEELLLEPAGDLGDGHAGTLIFAGGHERPEYVRWADVERIDLDRPEAMYPPLGAP